MAHCKKCITVRRGYFYDLISTFPKHYSAKLKYVLKNAFLGKCIELFILYAFYASLLLQLPLLRIRLWRAYGIMNKKVIILKSKKITDFVVEWIEKNTVAPINLTSHLDYSILFCFKNSLVRVWFAILIRNVNSLFLGT